MTHQPPQQAPSFETPRGNRGALVGIAAIVVVALGLLVVFGFLREPGSDGSAEGELLSSDTSATASGEGSEVKQTPERANPDASAAGATPDSEPDASSAVGDGLPESVTRLLEQATQFRSEGNDSEAAALLKQAAVQLQTQADQARTDGDEAMAERYLLALQPVQAEVEALGGTAVADEAPTLENRTPHAPPRAGEVREMTILELGNFPYDPDTGGVPADVEALEGMEIRLSGYMVPGYQTERLQEFTLVPDIYECCFGQPPGLEHTIFVKLPEGKSVSFYYGEVEVTGRLQVEEELNDGYVVNLFTIADVTSVRATGK